MHFFPLNLIASELFNGFMTIFGLNVGRLTQHQVHQEVSRNIRSRNVTNSLCSRRIQYRLPTVQLYDRPHLISTRYSFHHTEQVPVYRGRGSGPECYLQQYKNSTATFGHSLTKTEILHSAALIHIFLLYVMELLCGKLESSCWITLGFRLERNHFNIHCGLVVFSLPIRPSNHPCCCCEDLHQTLPIS